MKKPIHPYFIVSSYLMIVFAGLGLIKYFYLIDAMLIDKNIGIAITNLAIYCILAFLLRGGHRWVKYLMLAFALGAMTGFPALISQVIREANAIQLAIVAQKLILIAATALLFLIPKIGDKQFEENNPADQLW